MKKLLVALVASNLFMLSAVAMTPKSRQLVYPKSTAATGAVRAADKDGAYSPLGTSKRVTPAQAEKSRRLVYPSKASVEAERAAAVRSVKTAK